MLLAGDVGGTKTDLAVYSLEAGPYSPLTQAQMRSADYPSLQALVTEFHLKVKMPIERHSQSRCVGWVRRKWAGEF